MDDTIVALRFAQTGEARRAMREFKKLDRTGRLRVREAALLQRPGRNRMDVPSGGQDEDGYYLPPGGTPGMVLEALGGPLGMLDQVPAESFRGHGGRSAHDGKREAALEDISRNLEPGVTMVVVEFADPDPDALDSALAGFEATVTRRSAKDVYAELEAAGE
jgi:hypothetical protein